MAHKSILRMSADIENFRFNRAVAQLHILANTISDVKMSDRGAMAAKRFGIETLAQLLSPLSPHIAEEMWEILGHKTMLAATEWPTADETLASDDDVEIGIQVNGKLRDELNYHAIAGHLRQKLGRWNYLPFFAILTIRHPKKSLLSKTGLLMWSFNQNNINLCQHAKKVSFHIRFCASFGCL